ncbi:OsmC family protein [Actinomycetota bacterium]
MDDCPDSSEKRTLTTDTTNQLNDVDIETVAELIGAVSEEPAKAASQWSAKVIWTGAFRSEAHIREFAPIQSDEPKGLGGTDLAPNPVEQLIAALGNCLAVGYAANATAAGIELDSLEIDLEGDLNLETFLGLDSDGHAGYNAIRANVRIESDAASAAIEELHRQVIGTSPVGHTLNRAIDVAIELG